LFKKENKFSNRISINQLLILKHEANISKVKNPISGSYYISYLINQISDQSYDLFKELDENGNLIDHLYSGLIQKKIKENAIKEQHDFDTCNEIIVGANRFINPSEKIKGQCDIDPFLSRNVKTLIEPLVERRLASKIEKNKFLNE
jgi:methylmalonyl-CoA mutase